MTFKKYATWASTFYAARSSSKPQNYTMTKAMDEASTTPAFIFHKKIFGGPDSVAKVVNGSKAHKPKNISLAPNPFVKRDAP